jgi:hypothetical protein
MWLFWVATVVAVTHAVRPSLPIQTSTTIDGTVIVIPGVYIGNYTPTPQQLVFGVGTCLPEDSAVEMVHTPIGQRLMGVCSQGAYVDGDFFAAFTSVYGVCEDRFYFSDIPDQCKINKVDGPQSYDGTWVIENGVITHWAGPTENDTVEAIVLLLFYIGLLVMWVQTSMSINAAFIGTAPLNIRLLIARTPFVYYTLVITVIRPIYMFVAWQAYNTPPNLADVHIVEITMPAVFAIAIAAFGVGIASAIDVFRQIPNKTLPPSLLLLGVSIDLLLMLAIATSIPRLAGYQFRNLFWFGSGTVIAVVTGRNLLFYVQRTGYWWVAALIIPIMLPYTGYICMLPQFHHTSMLVADVAVSASIAVQCMVGGTIWAQRQLAS